MDDDREELIAVRSGTAGDGASGPEPGSGAPRRAWRGASVALWSACLLGAILACGPEDPPFPGSAPGLDALGRAALEAVVAGDTATLRTLRLTDEEHRATIWPELPESDPALNVPRDFVRANLERRNRAALARILPRYRDWEVRYRGTECTGTVHTFSTFRVHTGCRVRVERPDESTLIVELFEDAVERGGGWKLFRYYDHRPRLDGGRRSRLHGPKSPHAGTAQRVQRSERPVVDAQSHE